MIHCPFCLSTKLRNRDYNSDHCHEADFFPCGGNSYYVSCDICYARGPIAKSKEEAIEKFVIHSSYCEKCGMPNTTESPCICKEN